MKNLLINSISFALVLSILFGCNSHSISISPKLNLCTSNSSEEYERKLFSDTLKWAGDTETINFYLPKLQQIVTEVKRNCQADSAMVYPFATINNVVFYNTSRELSGKELNKDQIMELLSIINDPLNFGWGETTFEIEKMIVFKANGKEIAKLNIMDNTHIVSQPQNILMKSGALNEEGIKKFRQFINSI